MSEIKHVEDNVKFASEGLGLLTEGKRAHFACKNHMSKTRVNCAGCRYCMPCPSGVNIPENFKYLNNAEMFDNAEGEKLCTAALKDRLQTVRNADSAKKSALKNSCQSDAKRLLNYLK